MLVPGSQIGSYTLVRRVEGGDFDEAWAATDALARDVTIEFPNADGYDREAVREFALLWARASGHPNVVSIREMGENEGRFFIVTEGSRDDRLDKRLAAYGAAVSFEAGVDIIIQILDGLEYIHTKSVIHRDLKPANIVFNSGRAQITNLGISRDFGHINTENVSGTLAYMAPECFRGRSSIQSDIWSVGVITYQLFTGSLPFPQTSIGELVDAVTTREPAERSYLSPRLLHVVSKALAKDPSSRYSSAAEMREDLKFSKPPLPNEEMMGEPVGYYPGAQSADAPVTGSFNTPDLGIADGGPDKERETDSIGNLVKKVRGFFGKG